MRLLIAVNVVVLLGNVIFAIRTARRRRCMVGELAPVVGFVAALASPTTPHVPRDVRRLAQAVLPAWVKPDTIVTSRTIH